MLEVKDFTTAPRTKPQDLMDEIAVKVRDSLALLAAAAGITVKETDIRNKEELHQIDFPLVHPGTMLVDTPRDKAYFERYVRTPLFRRFKNAIKALLPDQVDKAITPFLGEMQRKLGLG